ncbi:hypothetical protein [Mycolicibacterium cosmeticum]|uniref:hypothetical protein n=1 Tax=Mycolicibacterium cosmeticum TaxID=258533 RepID=UPI0032049C20
MSFPNVQPVSGAPADWIEAVCEPHILWFTPADNGFARFGRVSLFPNHQFPMPDATFSAVCRARVQGSSSPVLLVARYPNEPHMQFDLVRADFKWYCFATDRGMLDVIATQADDSAQINGWGVSPVLEPLSRYGFMIYSRPGQ